MVRPGLQLLHPLAHCLLQCVGGGKVFESIRPLAAGSCGARLGGILFAPSPSDYLHLALPSPCALCLLLTCTLAPADFQPSTPLLPAQPACTSLASS